MLLYETIARRSVWLRCAAAAMSLTIAMGSGRLLAADDSQPGANSQSGTVDIKLKLVPSKPESTSETPPPKAASEVPQPEKTQPEVPQPEKTQSEKKQPEVATEGTAPLESVPSDMAKSATSETSSGNEASRGDGDIELTQYSDDAGPSLKSNDVSSERPSSKPSVKRLRFNPDASQSSAGDAASEAKSPERIVSDRTPQRLANLPVSGPANKLPTRSQAKPNAGTSGASPSLDLSPPRISSRRTPGVQPQLNDAASTDELPAEGDGQQTEVDSERGAESQTEQRKPEHGEECPGAPGSADASSVEGSDLAEQLEIQKDDVPLLQDEHPYDAPPARTIVKQRGIGTPTQQLSATDLRLQGQIQRVLAYYMDNPENTTRRGPWAIMHAALPFGVEGDILAGNRRVNALGWMCYNGVCAKQRMFQPTKQGFRTNVGPGVQGHEGQFLAILAQSRVQPDYPILIGNRRYTIMDLAKYEMATCREKSELTFKLIGLSHYLEPDQRWRDNQGRTWNLEKMVAEELAQPVIGSACGGTHRLMGLTFALVRRQQSGLPMTGHWHRAEVFINDFVKYAISLQNPDGSFSTNWFEGRGNEDDIERKLQTSGHIVEWLVFTLPDDQLRSPQIQRAVEFIASTLESNLKRDWPIGPRGHALRALALYHQRLYGGEPGQMREILTANRKTTTATRR